MANPFAPHFVGLFGLTCALVVKVLQGMRLPLAIERMPPEFKNELLASLAYDLADRLRFGVVLGFTPKAPFDSPTFDELWVCGDFRIWVAADIFREREQSAMDNLVRSDVGYLCASHEEPAPWRRRIEDQRAFENLVKRYAATLNSSAGLHRSLVEVVKGAVWYERTEGILRPNKFDARSVVSGHNLRLNDGAPYYLRNTDPVWWADFSQRVISRMAREDVPRWCCIRDRKNNTLVSKLTPALYKWGDCAAGLLVERIKGMNFEAEVYGLPKRDATLPIINGLRETCRRHDYYMLEWFEKKGLRWNPYTRWLGHLRDWSSSSPLFMDWKGVREMVDRFVPTGADDGDELRHAKLCWCLSRLNSDQYPYSPRFSATLGQKEGERLLHNWWQEVKKRQHAISVKKSRIRS